MRGALGETRFLGDAYARNAARTRTIETDVLEVNRARRRSRLDGRATRERGARSVHDGATKTCTYSRTHARARTKPVPVRFVCIVLLPRGYKGFPKRCAGRGVFIILKNDRVNVRREAADGLRVMNSIFFFIELTSRDDLITVIIAERKKKNNENVNCYTRV